MERSDGTRRAAEAPPLTPATASPVPARSPVATAGDPIEPRNVRTVPVAVGQRFVATVVAQLGDQIWFGYRGAILQARASRQLAVGEDVEFVVAATSPRIELEIAPAAGEGGAAVAARAPALGGRELLSLLLAALGRGLPSSSGDARELPSAVQQLARGEPTAAALAAIDRHLGHQHEARVLRLVAAAGDATALAAQLRGDAKARALTALAAIAGPDTASAGRGDEVTAAALATALGGIERDNAARAELQLPLWLPLPAAPDAGLLDARMFLLRGARDDGAGGGAAAAGQRPFTIVLLLDLSRLGALRVDVAMRGARVDATLVAVRPETVRRLGAAQDALRALLREHGLEVGTLQVRAAPTPQLPIADLVLPRRDGSSLVDCHA